MNYRRKANAVLGSVFLIFVVAAWLRHLWPNHEGIRFFLFVSEASLVGGIADWFAVTALFRKPLGWPYHTALIPRNRGKMIEGITAMVQNELLSEALLRQKIEGFHSTQWFIRQTEKAGGARFLSQKLNLILGDILGKLTSEESVLKLEKVIKEKSIEIGVSKRILVAARDLLDQEKFELWLNERIEEGIDLAAQPKVKEKLLESLGQLQQAQVGNGGMLQRTLLGIFQATDSLNLDEAAECLQVELILTLKELKQPNHPLRDRLKGNFKEKFRDWETDAEVLNTIELWKNSLIHEMNLEEIILPILEEANASLQQRKLPTGQALSDFLEPLLEAWWNEFKEDTHIQQALDKLVQDLLIRALQTEHAVIGQIVRETLEGLNDEELNRFIEDKAGEDLQWIRINGSLVGGIVGAALFLLLNYGYTPLLGMF